MLAEVEVHPAGTIPNRVREHREAAGLTQQVLATRAGLAIRTIARIEDGEDTKLGTLRAIAQVLDLELADLLLDAS
jgi:transcriptional regulator with XRE-family HTH domain